ncbi:MAG TPA: hypothetical protein VHV10_15610 [Ktedonobacteraceae bacterium]|nr:hypothetical protein [Ktedonobacteraceae bacterium]
MVGKQLEVVVEMFRAYLLDQGWSIVEEKDLQNGLQLLVTDGIAKVPIDCYTNGNAFIQGPAGVLKTELQTWWQEQKASPAAPILQDGVVPLLSHEQPLSARSKNYLSVLALIYPKERVEPNDCNSRT